MVGLVWLGTATPAFGATAAVGFSSDPVEDRPVSITVTGTTEIGRSLWTYVERGGTACEPTTAGQFEGSP